MTTHTAATLPADPFLDAPHPGDLDGLALRPVDLDLPPDEYDPTDVPDFPDHECELEAVESATYPTRSGAFTVTTSCDVCGRHLGTVHDSVL